MKIAVIHSIFKPFTRGGAEVVVENIARGLKDAGHNAFVVSVGRRNKSEMVDGIKVHRIRHFNFFNFLDINKKPAWLRLFWHILDMFNDLQTWWIYKVIAKEKLEIILTHNLKGLGYYLPWMLRVLKMRHIHTVHDMQLIHPSGLLDDEHKENVFTKIYSWFAKKLFGSPETVIFPSIYIKETYEQHGFFKDSKRVVVPNPIVIPTEKEGSLRASTEGGLSRDDKKRLNMLFLGQVEEYKGILELVEAVKDLDVKLHVVGDGSALEKAKAAYGKWHMADNDDKIIFHGRMSQKELGEKIWNKVDILVNPSKTPESFGMVVVEAYSHGVPVLATRVGALPELVDDEKTGWLVELSELKEKIKGIKVSEEMSKNCLNEAKKYSIDNYLNKLLDFVKID